MSVEAPWTVRFQTAAGWANGGVVVRETGRLFGGGSRYYYLGRFGISGNSLSGSARVVHDHGNPFTAFGDNATTFDVRLQGTLAGDEQ
jgi:hypothetical protein